MNSSIARAIDRMRRLKQLEGINTELEAAADDIVIPNAQIYPPERANQTYIRTFYLRESWGRSSAQRTGHGWRVVVRNTADYASDVVGEDQGYYFVNRWRTINRIRDENLPAVRARLAGAVRRLGNKR